MNEQFEQALNQIAEEKDINKDEILKMIEVSLAAAFRKDYGKKDQNIVVEFMPDTLGTKVFDVKKVVEEVTDPVKEILLADAMKLNKTAKVVD
jgi:N utilization substance protein A